MNRKKLQFTISVIILCFIGSSLLTEVNAQVTFQDVQTDIGETFPIYPNAAAWGDIDNDGDLDVYLTVGSNMGNDLMLNDLDNTGTFIKVDTTLAHRVKSAGPRVALLADIENDGDLDILTIGEEYQIWLILNNLVETDSLWFTDISEQVGIAHVGEAYNGASMADYNKDGLLDIYISGVSLDGWYPSLLLKNNGLIDGFPSLEDVADDAGIYSSLGMSMICGAWADYDNDHDQDIFIATMPQTPEFLYRNEGDGTFVDVSIDVGLGEAIGNSRTATWGDFDNDGDLDIFIGRRIYDEIPDMDICQFFRNDNGMFTEIESAQIIGENFYGVAAADYDNDGDLDLHLLNSERTDFLLRNDGNFTFNNVIDEVNLVEVTRSGWPVDIPDRGGQTWADWDADGDLDLLLPSQNGEKPFLMRNDGGNDNNWIELKLRGHQSNLLGVGARVTTVCGDLRQIREIRMGGGYFTGPPTDVHFGLGQMSNIDSLIIRWPSDIQDVFTDIAVNQILSIEEGSSSTYVKDSNRSNIPKFVLHQNYPNPFNPTTEICYELMKTGHVRIDVYSMLGQHITSLVDENQPMGTHQILFNAESLSAGLYLYRLTTVGFTVQKKMILLK